MGSLNPHLCIGPMGGKEGPKQWFLLKQVVRELLNQVVRQLLHKTVDFHLGAACRLLHHVAVNLVFCQRHPGCPSASFQVLLGVS